jgi:mannosidase alpha-like ER degradation enhancer 1
MNSILLFVVFISLHVYGTHATFSPSEREFMKNATREMFYYGFNMYMKYAFPHDELKPLSKSYTDSFVELGNLDLKHLPADGTYLFK